ncbi:MAG: DUF2283 domain-containing protein [Verrucomicrobiota bacterium]
MKKNKASLLVTSKRPPIIDVDPEAQAVYIYFKDPRTKVAKTMNRCNRGMIINIDLDAQGEVIGAESIGAGGISIEKIFEFANVDASSINFSKARIRPTQVFDHV